MPVALISTSTSPAFGPSRSSSTISSGFLASKATAARVFIREFPSRSWERGAVHPLFASSFFAHAGIFRLRIGVRFVFVLGRAYTPDRVMGAGAEIDIEVVQVAGDGRIIAKCRTD